jgi:Copper amine oxidase, enzyme domain
MTTPSKTAFASIASAAVAWLIAAGTTSFAGTIHQVSPAAASTSPPAAAVEALYRAHYRRIEEGIRASRAVKPKPIRPVANGVQQLRIDTALGRQLFKREGVPPSAVMRAQLVQPVPGCPTMPGYKVASLMKTFPDVRWHVCIRDMGNKSLWVGPVHIKRTPGSPWMTVLNQAGLSEIFVPYHQRTWFRPYDLNPWVTALDQVDQQDAGSNGTPIYLSNETVPTVVQEVRDRGMGWLCKQALPYVSTSRRTKEFVVWGIADGGNYDNIIQYSFRDDGSIGFRLGNTGYSDPSDPLNTSFEPHTHMGLWRVDMDLNGPSNNTAYWETHVEPTSSSPTGQLSAADAVTPFNSEGAMSWIDIQFKTLLIQDSSTNAFGNKLGYEFVPAETGVSRHFGPGETWTQNDAFVTRYHASETGWLTTWGQADTYLSQKIDGESTNNQDLVVWITSSAHHHPTDEDRSANDLNTAQISGITLVHWSGFDIIPHNLFNANPLGGPQRCGN